MNNKIVEVTRNPVTALANDELSEAEYREIFAELREQWSLDQFVTRLRSQYSKAQWSKWQRGEATLTPQMRNELRGAVGLVELPNSVAHSLAAVNADGAVYQVGEAAPNAALMWNERESPDVLGRLQNSACNPVTRGKTGPRTVGEYFHPLWGLDAVPGRILAWAIQNREEVTCEG